MELDANDFKDARMGGCPRCQPNANMADGWFGQATDFECVCGSGETYRYWYAGEIARSLDSGSSEYADSVTLGEALDQAWAWVIMREELALDCGVNE